MPGFTALIARARGPESFVGQGMPDGAEDGPGENAGIDSDAWCFVTLADNGPSRSEGLIEKGPRHSLIAEAGVSGDRPPRFADSRPPRIRLVLNSCNCMIKFMLGPIHLLRFLTASYASCTLNVGFL